MAQMLILVMFLILHLKITAMLLAFLHLLVMSPKHK